MGTTTRSGKIWLDLGGAKSDAMRSANLEVLPQVVGDSGGHLVCALSGVV